MKRKNMATMVTCIALVGAVAVGGTLALLSRGSNPVTNTFTVGKGYKTGDVILDEAPVKQETSGVNLGDYVEITSNDSEHPVVRVKENDYKNLIDTSTMDKDPQFHISGACEVKYSWIVAKVDGFNTTQGATTLKFTDVIDDTPENNAVAGEWVKVTKKPEGGYNYTNVTDNTQMGNGIYIYNMPLMAGQSTEDLFQELEINNFVAGNSPSTITVTGYAVEGVYSTTVVEGEETYTPVGYNDMRDAVMAQVDTWAFTTAGEAG